MFLNWRIQCLDVHHTASRVPFLIRNPFEEPSKRAFVSLCCSLVHPHLEYLSQAGSPYVEADFTPMERAERLDTRIVTGLKWRIYMHSLQKVALPQLKVRQQQADLLFFILKTSLAKVNLSLSRTSISPIDMACEGLYLNSPYHALLCYWGGIYLEPPPCLYSCGGLRCGNQDDSCDKLGHYFSHGLLNYSHLSPFSSSKKLFSDICSPAFDR